jgi:hypothetical protein
MDVYIVGTFLYRMLDQIDQLMICMFKLINSCNLIIINVLFMIIRFINEYLFSIDLCIEYYNKYWPIIFNIICIPISAVGICRVLYTNKINNFTIVNILSIYVSLASFFLLWYLHMENNLLF